jgi:hypothetical protein
MPGARGAGAGKALLARLAQRCVDADLGRLEWAVLNWNQPSIEFYRSLGARLMEEWVICRVEGDSLRALAEREREADALSTAVARGEVTRMPPADDLARVLGRAGVAVCDLDPDGVVQVASEEWSARSEGGTIAKGTAVRVIRVDGLRLVVEPAGEEAGVRSAVAGGTAANATASGTGTPTGSEGGNA